MFGLLATLKELRLTAIRTQRDETLSGLANRWCGTCAQGFKANPGLKLANTFGVKSFLENKNL